MFLLSLILPLSLSLCMSHTFSRIHSQAVVVDDAMAVHGGEDCKGTLYEDVHLWDFGKKEGNLAVSSLCVPLPLAPTLGIITSGFPFSEHECWIQTRPAASNMPSARCGLIEFPLSSLVYVCVLMRGFVFPSPVELLASKFVFFPDFPLPHGIAPLFSDLFTLW